jgi:hypothetical protein
MLEKRKWTVVFDDGKRKKVYTVEAVGYSQAITFAGDQLVREGFTREEWEPRRIDSIYAS